MYKKPKSSFQSIQLLRKLCTINMKFLLVSVVFLVGTVIAIPVTRQRRDILPGDPRYGTDYHHHHHHVHGDDHHHTYNTQATGKTAGTYAVKTAGTYAVPDAVYGPPGYQPGTPISTHNIPVVAGTYQTPTQVHNYQHYVPAATYGVPSQEHHHHHHEEHHHYQAQPVPTQVKPTISQPIDSYGTPVNTHVHHHEQVQKVQQPSNVYLTQVVENKKVAPTVNTKVYQKPKVNNGYLAPTVQRPVVSAPTVNYAATAQRSHVTVETVPATLQNEYTTVVRDEPAVATSAPAVPSFPSFPNFQVPQIPNFEVPQIPTFEAPQIPSFEIPQIPDFSTSPQIPDFSTASQIFSDSVANLGENYENFVSNVNTNGYTFPGFGAQTEEKVTVKQPVQTYKPVEVPKVTKSEEVIVENHHHEHHQHQYQQPAVQQESQQQVDSNGGYVY